MDPSVVTTAAEVDFAVAVVVVGGTNVAYSELSIPFAPLFVDIASFIASNVESVTYI